MYDLIDRQAVFSFLTDEWDGDILSLFKGIKRIPPAPMEMHMDSHGITVRPAIAYGEAEKAEEVAQPNLQSTCNQLATDTISRQED